jgi:acetoacetyl-CoA synthetase
VTPETTAEIAWSPTRESIEASRLWAFREWVREHRGLAFDDYPSMWNWSVTDPSAFWGSVREHFAMVGEGFDGPALAVERMPGAVWYPNARVNYAENVLRYAAERPDDVAVVRVEEDSTTLDWTWRELADRVAALQLRLQALGVEVGDRVVAVLPNVPEAIVALLATAGLGAIWSVSSPDLAVGATLDRFRPLDPKVLLGVTGHQFKGEWRDTRPALAEVAEGLPTATPILIDEPDQADAGSVGRAPQFVRLPFAHPLWVLFSSGTTGPPKGIVHGHGGMMLEAFKGIGLHYGMGPGKRYFTAANTSWMVWNTLGNTLLTGASVVTYAGSPTRPRVDRQFEVVAVSKATMLSTGAAYLGMLERSGLRPGDDWDLSLLEEIMSTGSVLAPSTWRWVHDAVKADVHLHSDSGGTDICSGFIGGNPWQPAIVGESQGPTLGHAIDVRREDGTTANVGEVGDLVITRPLPSMPVAFWNDPDGELYRAAYFEKDPSVWTHGDWIRRTPSGGVVVEGRSDATLNRDGVRLGSADIYAALQEVPEVRNAVVLGIEIPGGRYWMPLFVELADGVVLDAELAASISARIRGRASARHVPDDIEAVPGIPMTHAGKRIEIPLKKLFLGRPAESVVNRGALANPETVDWFIERAARFLAENGMGLNE